MAKASEMLVLTRALREKNRPNVTEYGDRLWLTATREARSILREEISSTHFVQSVHTRISDRLVLMQNSS